MNYETMTVAQLEKEKQKLGEKKAELKVEVMKICAVLEKKVDEIKVKEKIDSMTDKEKAIATQILSGAGAIVSEEAVGEPGTK